MEQRPRLKGNRLAAFENITKDENRVLVIGDLHEPFCLKGYLRFCKETYAKYNCNKVVFIGRIIIRKAQTSNIPSRWIKEFSEVLETPKWNFVTEVYFDDVRYIHGDKSSNARTATKRDMVSTVSGHFHTQMYVEWFFGKFAALFAMQVGCGIDSKSYAMGYMQGGKKEAIACGIVIGGHTAFNVKMDL
jgi:hypothetical protein